MAAGETTEVILDGEGRELEVELRWRDRIAAFNQLATFGLGSTDKAQETETLTELKAKLEEEVQAHHGLTLEELWTQCQEPDRDEGGRPW